MININKIKPSQSDVHSLNPFRGLKKIERLFAHSIQHRTNILLRETPVASAHMNKPVVIGIALFLAIVLAIAFIGAFSTSSNSGKTNSKIMVDKAEQNYRPVVSPLMQSLPKSYQDTEAIKKFLDTTPKAIVIPPEVQTEINLLKQQQAYLQSRLSEAGPSSENGHRESNIQADQAKNSGLFFPGVAPPEMKQAVDEEKASAQSQASSGNAQSGSDKTSPYEQQNMQGQKINFMKPSDEEEDIYNKHNLVKLASPYEIQAGTIVPAELITGINTSLPGDVVAQIQENLFDTVTGQYLLIPKGSKLLGKYDSQVAYGQERVLIVFYRVMRPDGSSILLSKAAGTDLLGQSGMQGDVNNHWAKVLGAATLSTLLSVGAGVASDNVDSHNNTYYRSAGQNAVLGGASGISSAGQSLTNQAINIQPTLTIPAGYQFNVIVNKDMVMEPYQMEDVKF